MAQSWFIMRGESRLGPFTHHGLVTLASSGGLSPQDMVWCTEMPAPIPAVGVAGLFPEPEPQHTCAHEPPEVPAPPAVPPPSPYRAPPPYTPPPRASHPTPAEEVEFSFAPSRRKDRFAGLFEDGGDTLDSAEVDDEPDDFPEPAIPVVRRPSRRVAPARRSADNSGLLIGLGGFALLAVIMLIVVLEQGEARQTRTAPSVSPPPPVVRPAPPRPEPPGPPAVKRPERAPPRPPAPRFDKQPLIDEMVKQTVDAIYQANPSLKSRYRELWESQLQTLLTQETKGMREEEEVRAAAKRVCDAWAIETQKFVAAEAAPPPSSDAIDGATEAQPDAEAAMEPAEAE